ncbi:class I SAM-dependent DNA methyltransferase [Sphingomonas sp. SUN039]|uniref:class I SAM-dependent DNA methyltransferase n=1 Tax=Sphingomonas sp. SUN039 TaxID=2937787 RepID=UPI00216450CF|nr:class I SAM-dependent DNA methyltransferase [Sphingomonas sp. SUN039]UVO54644.1 class I SAM-dependent DNA methyltransferase [Sphingomonas sp. SUN039]
MTPNDFIRKWRNAELKERSASQSHFNDLCALLGILDPVSADPTGDWFTFEKGATKTGGGNGWADVWRKGCFAWEYKGRHANLDKALSQLLQYQAALENPPLLIVSDMDRIIVRTNFTNTVQEKHDFELEDLRDGDTRERLKRAFTDPDAFKPSQTRTALTEETAREFAGLAQRLRDRGHDAGAVAHFVNQLVFCMFAEDSALLPDNMFTDMLQLCRFEWDLFPDHARTLFAAMADKGGKVGFKRIEWFNGGLFEGAESGGADPLPLTEDDVEQLAKAAKRDWSQIDPSILGTLFERGLDPAKRSQLGAHYTDRAKIDLIVRPVIVEPLEAEWADALGRMTALVDSAPKRTAERLLSPAEKRKADKLHAEAEAIHSAFIERLAAFRVLDPACGSGNFLYVALRALKDIEHRANLDAEALGLPRGFPRVGPECVLGIELNPYAAELARVSVWIGEIQWMRRNGFDVAKNPILRPLETIECRDAVLNADGTRAEWPSADVVVGNPPFLGNKKMIGELGENYAVALRKAWPEVPGGVDLVCYWFAKAWSMIVSEQIRRAGLVSTNSIRGGANREVLKPIVDQGRIFDAWSDEGWTVEGAAVRVSLIAFERGAEGSLGPHQVRADDESLEPKYPTRRPVLDTGLGFFRQPMLNGRPVEQIHADLTGGMDVVDLTRAQRLPENSARCFEGLKKYGAFDVPGSIARAWLQLPVNVNGRPNADVLFPWIIAKDIVRRPSDRWAIDFATSSEIEAAQYEQPFQHALAHVQPIRARDRNERTREQWWRYERPRPELRKSFEGLQRYIATPVVSKHRIFVWLSNFARPSNLLDAIARDDDTTFGILHSRFHELWSLRMGTFLGVGNDPRYTPSTTFETFPFPEGLTPDIPAANYANDPRAQAIAAAAATLNELRENWLNPADLIVREPEVVPGYPDRILPRDDDAAKELKKRTLTNLYNARPVWLANAHATLDAAVADAYGWGAAWALGMSDDDILSHLFALNQARSGR